MIRIAKDRQTHLSKQNELYSAGWRQKKNLGKALETLPWPLITRKLSSVILSVSSKPTVKNISSISGFLGKSEKIYMKRFRHVMLWRQLLKLLLQKSASRLSDVKQKKVNRTANHSKGNITTNQWEFRVKTSKCTWVTWRLVVLFYLIGREGGASFLDQSQTLCNPERLQTLNWNLS